MSDHDDLTRALGRELHEHADPIGGSLGLAEVQVRARSIRRHRAITAVVAVVAAVAVIAPTAAVAGHRLGGDDHPLPPATQSVEPSPTDATTDASGPKPGVLDVSSLPTGPDARIPYEYNGDIHFPDGSQLNVGNDHGTLDAFASLADQTLVQSWSDSQGVSRVYVRTAGGSTYGPYPSNGGLVVNDADTLAAWVRPDGQVLVWNGAAQPLALGDPVTATPELRVSTLIGNGCGPGTAGCTVYVNARGNPDTVWEVSDNGTTRLRDGGYLTLADMSEAGLSVGLTKITDSSTCSTLLGGGEFQGFSTCRNQLASFSPDGNLLLALPSYFDGLGPGSIGMYDLHGTRLFERSSTQQTQAFFSDAAWEDDTHVLAPVFQGNRWSIVRFGSDGSMEYVVPPVAGSMDHDPFVLATTP